RITTTIIITTITITIIIRKLALLPPHPRLANQPLQSLASPCSTVSLEIRVGIWAQLCIRRRCDFPPPEHLMGLSSSASLLHRTHYRALRGKRTICLRRALWGVDIYTDDSDPVAAAIHAGWIRGEWADDVDLALLDIGSGEDPATGPKTSHVDPKSSLVLTRPPAKPVTPPAGMDLHLTLLILPTLQSYASSVAHGLRSRGWGDTHDGMSFQIQEVAWVDEGIASVEERGGEARRKRLKAMMSTAKLIPSPPLRLDLVRQGIAPMRATAVAA
ncbi:hypothetical protein MMC08_003691, partial [Hypocenomyce scalaris]|nr:hypothetical protein [Hypocenomyce scalaris]